MTTYAYTAVNIPVNTDISSYLDYQGQFGRELVQVYNSQLYFRNDYYFPFSYIVLNTPDYIADAETSFNALGAAGWEFVAMYNDYAIFKQMFTNYSATTPAAAAPPT